MNHPICDQCGTVNHCLQHGCIPVQKLKPCRSPYCECSHNVCTHSGYYDARSEPFEHPAAQPAPVQQPVALQMDVIVVNLVREGINKHRARELAEHFIKHTTPPAAQRQWTGLTDEERQIVLDNTHPYNRWTLAERIESKLKEKNT